MAAPASDDSLLGIAVVAAIVFAIFMGYPMLTEGTGNSCLALEKRALGGAAYVDNGRAAEQSARKALPDIPYPFACTYLYWKSVVDK